MASKRRSPAGTSAETEQPGATSGSAVSDPGASAPKRQMGGTERRAPGRAAKRDAGPATKGGGTSRSPKAAKRKAVGAAKQKDRKHSSTTTKLSGADLHGRSKGGASKSTRKGTTAGAKKSPVSKKARGKS